MPSVWAAKHTAERLFYTTEFDSLFMEGLCYMHADSLNMAQNRFETCAKLQPKSAAVAFQLSSLYALQQDTVRSIDQLKKATKLNKKAKELKLDAKSFIYVNISVLNDRDGVGMAMFDEVDTGISGKTSRKIGIKLSAIGQKTQVICITHSAQVASLGTQHLHIVKNEQDGRAYTSVHTLQGEQRVCEIARILGGIHITEAQMQAARDMLSSKDCE